MAENGIIKNIISTKNLMYFYTNSEEVRYMESLMMISSETNCS